MRGRKLSLWSTCCLAAIAVLLALLGGCATILRGGKQTVQVVTDPPGVSLVVDGKTHVTPAAVEVKRKKSYDVLLTKDGYHGVRFVLHPRWDAGGTGAVVMDAIIPGGTVLFIIDTFVGADRKFNKIATIKLSPAAVPTTQVVTLYEYKGVLLSQDSYNEAMERDKWFGKKKKQEPLRTMAGSDAREAVGGE